MTAKTHIKKTLYNKRTFFFLGISVWVLCTINNKWPSFFMTRMALLAVKVQLTIGYRAGLFAYFNDSIDTWSLALNKIESNVLKVVSLKLWQRFPACENVPNTVLFTTSFISQRGGHTRLIQSFLAGMPDSKLFISVDAFFTGRHKFLREQNYIIDSIFPQFKKRITLSFSNDPYPFAQLQINYTQLLKIQPKTIVLFNDNVDLALIIAVYIYSKQTPGTKTIYYHHADDHLPFLCKVFDLHVDVEANQDIKCASITGRSRVRISVPDRKFIPKKLMSPTGFTVFSFVPAPKISLPAIDGVSFVELIAELTQKKVMFVLAVRNGEGDQLTRRLLKAGAIESQFKIDENCLDIVKYKGYVHAYLDTYPIGGGMSVVDALSMGIPPIINGTRGNQVFRETILQPFTFINPTAVFKNILKLRDDQQFLQKKSKLAHELYRNYYSEKVMVNNIRDLIK